MEQKKTGLVEASAEFLSLKTSSSPLKESSEDKAVTKKVEKIDPDSFYQKTIGHEHIYSGGQSDRENHTYHVHNTSTGKTHSISLDHGGKTMSHKAVRSESPKEVSDAAVKHIHKDHKEEMTYSDD